MSNSLLLEAAAPDGSAVTELERGPRLHTVVLPVSGRQINLNAGDVLEIQMRQIVDSGSAWAVARTPEAVEFERDEHYTGQRGSFTTRLFRFRAVGAGVGILRLAIGRPGMTEPLGQVDLHLTVFA